MKNTLDARQQKGLMLAAVSNIVQSSGTWTVPSQFDKRKYSVSLDPEKPRCNCADFEIRGSKCKHIFAVEYVIERQRNGDGTQTVTETIKLTATKRTTYPQNWPAYNAAQTGEKHQFQVLLHDLCSGIQNPIQTKGRPRLPLSDAVFSITFKIYSTFSGRRFMSDLNDAHQKGYISAVPHFNSIFNYLENPVLESILTCLIIRSSLPLKAVESDFAVDSTGFTTSRFVRWFDHKYGAMRQQHGWVKAHMMCGVKTNVVTAIEIRDPNASDTKLLPPLLSTTAENFTVSEVSADKGYSSINNVNTIAKYGAIPFVIFKGGHNGKGGGVWEKMFHFFQFKRDEFLTHYHKRSNVESTISMIKAKFRDHVRSKTDVAMKNEVLCKALCHNICCLIQATHELGINPTFSDDLLRPKFAVDGTAPSVLAHC